jgi:hypothetical protein
MDFTSDIILKNLVIDMKNIRNLLIPIPNKVLEKQTYLGFLPYNGRTKEETHNRHNIF